jgi:hypothetical protein
VLASKPFVVPPRPVSSDDILSEMAADGEMAAGEAASADEERAAGEAASLALAHQLIAADEAEMQALQTQIAGDAEMMQGIFRCE